MPKENYKTYQHAKLQAEKTYAVEYVALPSCPVVLLRRGPCLKASPFQVVSRAQECQSSADATDEHQR